MSEERYEIIKLLGKGRTGGVYEAEDTLLGRKVAMRRFFSQSSFSDVSEHQEEFVTVAQSLSALQHPNLLRVFDAGVDEDGAFIISQLLKGDTLHNRLKEGALPLADVYDLAQQMLDALSAAHQAGFIHGAITPGSIMMTPRARGGFLYVILDMGLCRLAPLIQGEDSVLAMMADPALLAPELFDGSAADERADLYMLGHLLYMSLAGGHPFAGHSLEECAKLHKEGLPPLSEYAADAPPEFIAWIDKLCQIQPENRPENVAQALNSLPEISIPPRTQSGPIPIMPAAATTAAPATNIPTNPTAGGRIPPTAGGITGAYNTTGPLTSSPATTVSPVAFQKKKSNAKLWISLAAGLGIIAILIMMLGGSKKDKKTTDKQKSEYAQTREHSRPTQKKSQTPPLTKTQSKRPVIPQESLYAVARYQAHPKGASLKKADSPAHQGWSIVNPSYHSAYPNTWRLDYKNPRKAPALLYELHHSDANDIFDLGWKVTYTFKAIKGTHLVGWNLSAAHNVGWLDDENKVSVLLQIKRDGANMIISSVSDKTKSHTLHSAVKQFTTIVIRGRANDPDGKFVVLVNGKQAWTGQLAQNIKVHGASNTFFTTAGLELRKPSAWAIKELKLETLSKP